uniref:ethanolamine-phosphate cytidylyltransferase n=1 Tax=Culicoides sonorensis TaxID=179676 RepID=A0A336M216_CULSO
MGGETKNEEENNAILRVWVDGCFDMGHFGHVNLLRQAKNVEIIPGKKNYLVVGVHSDEEILKHKRLPIFTQEERIEMVKSCKFVDEVVSDAPYITTVDTLKKHKCEFTIHGNDISISATGTDTYAQVKSEHMYHEVDRTLGISTTELIKRVLNDKNGSRGYTKGKSVNMKYFENLINEIKNEVVPSQMIGDFSHIVYCEGSFDLYHPGHVKFLKNAKMRGTYLIVKIYDDQTVRKVMGPEFPIMKLHERILTVLGSKFIDELRIGGEINKIPHEIQEKYKNIEFYEGLQEIEQENAISLQIRPSTYEIRQRINDRRSELMSMNAKKEAKEEELAVTLMSGVKIQ